ncbi:hypothetical protein ACQ858_08195 [Variovorax ureilyticus]|uniref:hypothetical protein n=1 Tax=Variovorax ureilyticus TaxID=1836198 RepID=UPI003D679F65
MTSRSLHEVAKPRPLTQCGLEELAVHQITATPSGGILFARKKERGEKDEARRYIVDLLGDVEAFPTLSVLTLPGLDWKFENKLLGRREGNWAGEKRDGPARTEFVCIENDRAIYHAALTKMPGMQPWKNRYCGNPLISVLPGTKFAERAISNPWIDRFYFGNVDDLMRDDDRVFDAAWLDYTGPLSIERLALIQRFYRERVRRVLVVTALRARWNRETSDAITRAGGHSPWFLRGTDAEVLHDMNYQDGPSPMAQIAIKKVPA